MERSGSGDLPEDLLCRVFTAREAPGRGPVLDVRDKARCEAVSTQWRRCLRSLPLEQLDILVSSDPAFTDPQAAWAERNQLLVETARVEYVKEARVQGRSSTVPPAPPPTAASADTPSLQTASHLLQQSSEVLQVLRLVVPHSMVQRFRPALQALPQLRMLRLFVADGGSMDASLLRQLSSLQGLTVGGYGLLEIRGGALPPSLTSLDASGCGKLDIDASMPHLRTLIVPEWATVAGDLPALSQLSGPHTNFSIDYLRAFMLDAAIPWLESLCLIGDIGGGVRMKGSRLSLPGLTRLDISSVEFECLILAEIDFKCMPALRELDFYEVGLVGGGYGFSTLRQLTSLKAEFGEDRSAGTAQALLRAAPPSLRSLKLPPYIPVLQSLGFVEVLAGYTQLTEVNGRPYLEAMALLRSSDAEELEEDL